MKNWRKIADNILENFGDTDDLTCALEDAYKLGKQESKDNHPGYNSPVQIDLQSNNVKAITGLVLNNNYLRENFVEIFALATLEIISKLGRKNEII